MISKTIFLTYIFGRGGRSNVLDSDSAPVLNFFYSGSRSGYFSNLRIRRLFRHWMPSIQLAIFPYFYLRNDQEDSCYCRKWKVTPDPGPVFRKFLTPGPDPGPKKNVESCRSRLRHSGSMVTSDFWTSFANDLSIQQFPPAKERMAIFTLPSLPGLHDQTAWIIILALINAKRPIAWKKRNAFHYFILFIRIAFQTKLIRYLSGYIWFTGFWKKR